MNRWVALLGALALFGTGCTTRLAGAAETCRLGSPPPAGQITYVADGRLMAVGPDGQARRCLADHLTAAPRWDPPGDRALVGATRTLLADRSAPTRFTATDRVSWSPAGTSLLAVTADGRLLKGSSAGGPAQDITFLNRYDSALYHPGGRAIVAVGDGDGDPGYGIYLADSTGALQATLAVGETTRHIDSLTWTDDGHLIFVAQHPDRWDLHRLDLTTGTLTTVASTTGPDQPITDVVTSPFPGGGVAWRQGSCAPGRIPATKMLLAGQPMALPPALAGATPIGWLPDATLVLVRGGTPCRAGGTRASPGDIYSLRSGTATRIASGAVDATVRVVHPPPPPLPTNIPSDAPV